MVCCVVEGVALLAVDVVALCGALCAEEASIKEATWVRARSRFCRFDERCGSGGGGGGLGGGGSGGKFVVLEYGGCKGGSGGFWYAGARGGRCDGKGTFCGLVVDERVDDVLYVAGALEEGDGDVVPCLVVELWEGGFAGDVEGVERMFQLGVVFGLAVVNGEDGWCWCRRGVVTCVGGFLMGGEIGEVCFDYGVKCGRKNADV